MLGAPFAVTGFVDGRVIRTVDELGTLTDSEIDSCVRELVRGARRAARRRSPRGGTRILRTAGGIPVAAGGAVGRQWERSRPRELRTSSDCTRCCRTRCLATSRTGDRARPDYRIDNTLVAADDPGRVVAVVDWELSTLGDHSPTSRDVRLSASGVGRDPG
ncbi:hypothetical protein GS425_16735 [Rhodococcus hoagii]|nr:hypothetical protein [Prescottella equi]